MEHKMNNVCPSAYYSADVCMYEMFIPFKSLFLFLKAFNDVDIDDDDEEDAPLKPTAIGRLGRTIEPGDRSKILETLSYKIDVCDRLR
jgi:hypothetical protein